MKAYTWIGGGIEDGIAVQKDERFGPVVFLGEEGRGRRYEKVGLFRKNPAEVQGDRVHSAHPVKITVRRGTEKEQSFFTLAKPRDARDNRTLVRIDTSWVYTRGTTGRWEAVRGNPEDLVAGYGAHGAAGRIGSWDDGLIVMSPGDVVRVKPEGGHKTQAFALICSEDGVETMPFEEYESSAAADDDTAEVEFI